MITISNTQRQRPFGTLLSMPGGAVDATRVRALKVYEKQMQANAIDFIDHTIEKFPFRTREIRRDNGLEFQAKFHRHVEGLGVWHADIKRRVDLEARIAEWERFYNFA